MTEQTVILGDDDPRYLRHVTRIFTESCFQIFEFPNIFDLSDWLKPIIEKKQKPAKAAVFDGSFLSKDNTIGKKVVEDLGSLGVAVYCLSARMWPDWLDMSRRLTKGELSTLEIVELIKKLV